MGGESARQRKEKRRQNHRQRKRRQQNMWDENEEVDGSDDSLPLKLRIAVHTVINNVCDKEQSWWQKRAGHKSLMNLDASFPDRSETGNEAART